MIKFWLIHPKNAPKGLGRGVPGPSMEFVIHWYTYMSMVVIGGFEPVLYDVGTFVVAEDNYSQM